MLSDSAQDINSIRDKDADKLIGNILEIELEAIAVNPFQPRTNFNEEALKSLGCQELLDIIQNDPE